MLSYKCCWSKSVIESFAVKNTSLIRIRIELLGKLSVKNRLSIIKTFNFVVKSELVRAIARYNAQIVYNTLQFAIRVQAHGALAIFINRLHSRIDPSLRPNEYLTFQSIEMYLRRD